MRADFNAEGEIELFPESGADVVALQHWEAHFPVRTIHEGTLEPMKMRPVNAVKLGEKNG